MVPWLAICPLADTSGLFQEAATESGSLGLLQTYELVDMMKSHTAALVEGLLKIV